MTSGLTTVAIDALERAQDCARASGIKPDELIEKLLATIRELQRELVQQARRASDAMQSDAVSLERTCEHVRELEGHLRAVITERLQGDNREPQPALAAALAYLEPGRRQYVMAEVENLGRKV